MITVYRCLEVSGACPSWAIYSQRAPHAPMCPTCHCNQTARVAIVDKVENMPENKAHSAWLAIVDSLTLRYYAALLYIVSTRPGDDTRPILSVTEHVDDEREELGLRPLVEALTDDNAGRYADTVATVCCLGGSTDTPSAEWRHGTWNKPLVADERR